MTLPYDHAGYADTYDARYNLSDINAPHFEFECALIADLVEQHTVTSWCDIGCGTGLHLRSVPGVPDRTGIDRAPGMLAHARAQPGPDITWVQADIRDVAPAAHDLVTALWYGYVHQDSLEGVAAFLIAAADQVGAGGTFLLGLCDPSDLFRAIPASPPMCYGGEMRIDALIWSCTEPWEGHAYANCIAPHPQWILDRLAPLFDSVRAIRYPQAGRTGIEWTRRALLFEGRKTPPKHATGLQFPASRFAGRQAGRRGGVSNAPSRHKDTARAGT